MDNQPQDQNFLHGSDQEAANLKPHKTTSKLIYVLVTIAILIAGLGIGYWYGDKTQKVAAPNSKRANESVSADSQDVHYVKSVGYPLYGATNDNQFVTKLGVPSFLQAVRISSTIQNQGDVFPMFTDGTFNNELGRWSLGDPNNPEENGGGTSEISLIAITDDWMNKTGTTDYSTSTSGNPLETPAQKQQYINQLKTETSTCSKDSSKGFVTADGNLAVCFTYSYGKEGYAPSVWLTGYGDVQKQQFVLSGDILIYDSFVGSSFNAQHSAIDDALKGDVPTQTARAQKAIIAALKKTTITVSPNPNK